MASGSSGPPSFGSQDRPPGMPGLSFGGHDGGAAHSSAPGGPYGTGVWPGLGEPDGAVDVPGLGERDGAVDGPGLGEPDGADDGPGLGERCCTTCGGHCDKNDSSPEYWEYSDPANVESGENAGGPLS